jgi:hypothetical protein
VLVVLVEIDELILQRFCVYILTGILILCHKIIRAQLITDMVHFLLSDMAQLECDKWQQKRVPRSLVFLCG